MNCKDLSEKELLAKLKSDLQTEVNRVINCFYSLYYNEFLKVSWNLFSGKNNYSKTFREQAEKEAFNDGLNDFYFYVRDGKYVHKDASLQTAFLTFPKYKLMGIITDELRNKKREPDVDFDIVIELNTAHTTSPEDITERGEKEKTEEHIFHTAWQNLGDRCRNLLTWRKYKKLSNEEIEKLCGVDANAVNNEVYRCFMRLKKNANGLMHAPN